MRPSHHTRDCVVVVLSVFILSTIWFGRQHAPAQSIAIENTKLAPAIRIHAQPSIPPGWELEPNSNSDSNSDRQRLANVRAWSSPGDLAIAIGKSTLSQTVDLPEIDPRWVQESNWKLVLAVDVTGKFSTSDRPAKLTAIVEDPAQNVLGQKSFKVTNDAPISKIAKPFVTASSFHRSGAPSQAFDGDPGTSWHSDYGNKTPEYPHHLTLDFGEIRTLRGATYQPRLDGGNGTLKTAALQFSLDGETWKTAIEGEFSYPTLAKEQRIVLKRPVKCRAIRLLCKSEIRGAKFASCAEFTPDLVGGFDGLNAGKDEPAAKIQRCFLPIELDSNSLPKSVKILLQNDSLRFVVVNGVHLMYVPVQATAKMYGKANGHNGPDRLGAGSYGFQARMVHEMPVLSVVAVDKGSPAARAKLKPTDVIVGINGEFLPAGNVAPGFEWLESSHEALLGRAAVAAFESGGDGTVVLDVLRGDDVVQLPFKLRLPREIANADFLTNPDTLEMLNAELIQNVLATQNKNGAWNNDPIRTSLGGLALLSTGNPKYARQIKSAANYIMARNAEPGPGFYWHPAFSGIFLSEYFLATGDERALPVIERMLRLMGSTFHTSKWGTQTFGHGPKGLPYGNKSLVAVMVHVLVFEELAERCGFESEIYETLIPYLESAWSDPATGGHGAMGYNASYKDLGEFWSRTGLFGLKLNMSNLRKDVQAPMAEIMRKRHPWFRNSHAYGEPGGALGLIGLSQMNYKYFEEVLEQYKWWFALAWQKGNGLHFTIPHMGAPYMESAELINNGYAIVTNIHKSHLQILGGKKRNWLDVSKIDIPISDVMVLQGLDGKVRLRCKIPGPDIFYTTDGSAPNRRSKKYSTPFEIAAGGVIQAIAIAGNASSKVASRGFGYDKSKWRIASANGDADQQRAVDRAAFAIDGDRRIGWVPDQGEGTRGYPYEMVVDLGARRSVNFVGINYVFANGAAAKINAFGSNDPATGFKNLGDQTFEKFTPDVRIDLSGDQVRFLKIVFEKPLNEGSNLLMVGEIDVR